VIAIGFSPIFTTIYTSISIGFYKTAHTLSHRNLKTSTKVARCPKWRTWLKLVLNIRKISTHQLCPRFSTQKSSRLLTVLRLKICAEVSVAAAAVDEAARCGTAADLIDRPVTTGTGGENGEWEAGANLAGAGVI
jgi:hypothetical protein